MNRIIYLVSALVIGLCVAIALSLRYQTTGQAGVIYVLDRWTGKVQFCSGGRCEPSSESVRLLTRIRSMLPEFIGGEAEELAPSPPPSPPQSRVFNDDLGLLNDRGSGS